MSKLLTIWFLLHTHSRCLKDYDIHPFMKSLILIIVSFVFPTLAIADGKIQIKPANELWCILQLQTQFDVVRNLNPNVQLHQNVLGNTLDKWLIEFDIGNDPIAADNTQSICLGFYNESSGPNAVAYGQIGILFGTSLLSELAQTAAPTDYWNNLKYILAHEFAHYLQNRYELKFNYILPMLSVKMKELHADCIAGYLVRLHKEAIGESQQNLAHFVASLGDSHAVGDHGLAQDRVKAFQFGLRASAIDILKGKKTHEIGSAAIIQHCNSAFSPTK